MNIFSYLTQPIILLQTIGLLGLFLIIFAESGLFFGFFFPGDSLLFAAGILAAGNYFNIFALCVGAFLAAVLGDSVGYTFGRKVGLKLFNKEDSFFFHRKHITQAEDFYKKYGNKTIFLARFIPIVRTFAPIIAGIGQMKYRDFIAYNVFGALVWSLGVILSGYFLGHVIPGIDQYLVPIILLIIAISCVPIIFEYFKAKKQA